MSVRLNGRIEALNQSSFLERLREEADRPIANCLFSRALVRESCDEDEGHRVALTSQSGLQLDPTHRRHPDVSDHAPASV